MPRSLHFIFALILTLTCFGSAAKTLLVLGDSLSAGYGLSSQQGWVQLLAKRLDEEALDVTVVNASISGETTAGGLRRLPALLAEHRPTWLLIELGGNDGLRGYPIGQMRNNLQKMIRLGQDSGAKVMVMEIWLPPNYGPRYLDAFKASFGQVAKDNGARLLPFFAKDVATQDGMIQADGIHPTAQAQPALLEALWPHLQAAGITADATGPGTSHQLTQ
ncbi:arylesterase [Gallaecimonas sp. GXIMD4217]|uniref:arylesterase n=1 Tax=Gallaecimonas sp. GXIMD4217 TaxID=3131927 RepID=UPI00311B4077